jgi:hypothetical protein
MPRQITDEEYAFLQNKRMTADFVESIYNDPQLTKEAKRLIKRKYPNLAIPDLDIEDKVEARLEADKKSREDAENKRRQDAEDASWRATRKKTQDAYGFTDEAMGEMEKWMQEKGVGDYEVAAEYRASKNPKTSDPGGYDSQYWHHDKAPAFKEIAADPEAWGRKEILGAINRDNERARAGR